MSAPGTPKRDAAAAACRNAQHELAEIAERLTRLRNDLSDLPDRWVMLNAENSARRAADACRAAADALYRNTKEEQE